MHTTYLYSGCFIQFILLLTYVARIESTPSVCDTFECDSDKCLSFSSVCNGISDCLDGTDEGLHCKSATVECVGEHEYLCDDGQCILNRLRCDGPTDCMDGSDEAHCDVDYEQPFCKEFTCDNGQRCLSLKYLCDGQRQCTDGTDESGMHCTILSSDCSGTGEFLCRNGHCLPAMFRCDGSSDCVDDSDEQGCMTGIATHCSGASEFLCLNGHCLPTMFRCDGATDCLDKSDEQGCPTEAPFSPIGLGTTENPLTTNSGTRDKAFPTTKKPTTYKRIITTEKTQKPTTTSQIISVKTSPTRSNNDVKTSKLFTHMTSSRAPITHFNVINNQKPSNKREDNKDVGTFLSKRASHHMRSIYGGTAIVLTVGTIAVIALVVIRRRIRKRPKPSAAVFNKSAAVFNKTSIHFINPFYSSSLT